MSPILPNLPTRRSAISVILAAYASQTARRSVARRSVAAGRRSLATVHSMVGTKQTKGGEKRTKHATDGMLSADPPPGRVKNPGCPHHPFAVAAPTLSCTKLRCNQHVQLHQAHGLRMRHPKNALPFSLRHGKQRTTRGSRSTACSRVSKKLRHAMLA